MSELIMPITCPRCGNDVDVLTMGRPMEAGTEINFVIRCTKKPGCGLESAVHIRIMAMGVYDDDGLAHGTALAVKRHRAMAEEPCADCQNFLDRRALQYWHTQEQKKRLARVSEPLTSLPH